MFWFKWWSNVPSSLILALTIRFITWSIQPCMLSLIVNPGMIHRWFRHVAIVPFFVEALPLVIQKTLGIRLNSSDTLNSYCSRFCPLLSPSISTAATTRFQSFQLSSIKWRSLPLWRDDSEKSSNQKWYSIWCSGYLKTFSAVYTLHKATLKIVFGRKIRAYMYPGKPSPEHHVWSYLRMSTKSSLHDCKAREDHAAAYIPQADKATNALE